MTNDEAKFLLHAYRPSGADSGDQALRGALEHAQRDPALRAWFEREQAHDRVVTEKLRAINPPAGLREAILAGARVSTTPAWWRRPSWLAAAASVAILLAATLAWVQRDRVIPLDDVTRVATHDMAQVGTHGGHGDDLGAIGAWLADPGNRLRAGIPVDLAQLRADRCRTVRIGGREIFEICFKRDTWYHVYIAPRRGIGVESGAQDPLFRQQGSIATATWADAKHVYVLATDAGIGALQRVL